MKQKRIALAILGIATLLAPAMVLAWDANAEQKAQEAVAEFKEADPDIQSFFDQAHGYAVFPSVGKGGMGIGGAHGSGVVYVGDTAVGTSKLTQITIGLQFGGQAFREIIFFEDEAAFNSFITEDFELSAQASAVAATAGASAATNFDNGMAVFTMAKGGLMYEATVGGQGFSYKPT